MTEPMSLDIPDFEDSTVLEDVIDSLIDAFDMETPLSDPIPLIFQS